MFNSLTGILSAKNVDSVFLSSGPIEWDMWVSGYTWQDLPAVGQEVKLFTYLHHKEDIMKLIGFSSELERKLFLELNKVSGIGPKGALKLFAQISPQDFYQILDSGDAARLAVTPGIGLKTAQKIVLTLKGRVDLHAESAVGSMKEISLSLVEMGFEKKLVEKTLSAIQKELDVSGSNSVEIESQLVQLALNRLTGKSV